MQLVYEHKGKRYLKDAAGPVMVPGADGMARLQPAGGHAAGSTEWGFHVRAAGGLARERGSLDQPIERQMRY